MAIVQIQIVINFQTDPEIVLTVGNSIKNLQKYSNAKIQILNVPKSAPAEAPRMIVFSQNAIINICLNRYDIIIKPPKHINSEIISSFDFVQSVISELLEYLVYNDFQYQWSGIVLTIEYALSNGEKKSIEVVTPFYDKLININRNNNKLASFQLQFGFEENGYYKNYTLSGYDKINFELPMNLNLEKQIPIDKNKLKIIESGVQIIIDINNKVLPQENVVKSDYLNIIKEIIKSYNELPRIFNIEGLI